MTSKSKKKGAMQAVAHLVQLNATNTETDRHSFLDRPAKTNVDISRVTDVRAFDRADTELTAARAWPKGLSEERKKNAVRIWPSGQISNRHVTPALLLVTVLYHPGLRASTPG